MNVGYARTSTTDQAAGLAAQERDLRAAGAERIFGEQLSSVAKRVKRGIRPGDLSMGGERLDTRNPTSRLMLTILAGVETWSGKSLGGIRRPVSPSAPTPRALSGKIMLERQRDPDHNVARPPLIHRGEPCAAISTAGLPSNAARVAAMGVRAVIGIYPIAAHLGHGPTCLKAVALQMSQKVSALSAATEAASGRQLQLQRREWQSDNDSERRMNLLIDRLPASFQKPARWLRQPSSRWVRIPVGILLIIGSFLSVLPVFGLWMLPLAACRT